MAGPDIVLNKCYVLLFVMLAFIILVAIFGNSIFGNKNSWQIVGGTNTLEI